MGAITNANVNNLVVIVGIAMGYVISYCCYLSLLVCGFQVSAIKFNYKQRVFNFKAVAITTASYPRYYYYGFRLVTITITNSKVTNFDEVT